MATNFDPSIYDIQETVSNIGKMYIPNESENTLALGLFGYLTDIASLQIQNDIILNSELGNELWPSRAKYEKNVIAHSIIQNITDINAKPAIVQVLIGFDEEKLSGLFNNDIFTVDKEYTFRIGNFDFHLEYDLQIQRSLIVNQKYVYSAKYMINPNRKNFISEITNPYTATPYIQIDQGKRMVYVPCQLMQVTHTTEHRKIFTSSSVDNRTFEFTFIDQLADFEVVISERGNTVYLTPIFDGAPIENSVDKFCYYTYIDAQTIRVRFDSLSYLPTLNADVNILVKTTKGSAGNFKYDNSEVIPLIVTSDRFNYKNLYANMLTINSSYGGEDRKTVEELRRLLPKEALSRGSITTTQDLKNYFNTMILDSSKLRIEIMKKISNDFQKRSYYAYLLMKDEYDNVIPTNTINIEVPKSLYSNDEYATHDNRKYVLKPGCYIVYENNVGHIYKSNDPRLPELLANDTENLIYTVPFMVVVTADPLYVSYYLPIMNYPVYFEFNYINENSPVQFISTSATWTRRYLTDKDTYFLDMELTQNLNESDDIVEYDKDGNIINSRLKVLMVIKNDDSNDSYRYAYGEVIAQTTKKLHVQMKFKSADQINDDNKIRIEDVFIPKSTAKDYGYFTNHVSVDLYVLYQYKDGKQYEGLSLSSIVPDEALEGWTVTNKYTINGGLNFYYNYSQVMSSIASDTIVKNNYDGESGFLIKSVPVVKRSYMNNEYLDTEKNEHIVQELINQFNYEKAYIDNATELLENNFLIDFKLFNSYGKSRLYSIDKAGKQLVDRVHLTLKFEVRLLKTSDNNTKDYILRDIKQMIEDLNDLSSLHIPNLITKITNTYRNSIEYIEFKGFNTYDNGPGIQHLYKQEDEDITAVPEFLCINTLSDTDMYPDIVIDLV